MVEGEFERIESEKLQDPKKRQHLAGGAAAFAGVFLGGMGAEARQKVERKSIQEGKEERDEPQTLSRILLEQLEEGKQLELNESILKRVEARWLHYYDTGPGKKKFGETLDRMSGDLTSLRATFRDAKNKVPEKYVLLTIPESWYSKVCSKKGACGPFQFTKDRMDKTGKVIRKGTGGAFGLTSDDDFNDPIKSGEAAAKYLKYEFEKMRTLGADEHEAWPLTLHRYNGSFAERYARSEFRQKRKPTLRGFINYMQERMRSRLAGKETLPPDEVLEHEVQSGEALWGIARRYNVTVDALKKVNDLHSDVIQPGDILQIPESPIRGQNNGGFTYVIQKGDTFSGIEKKLKLSPGELQKLNPSSKPESLRIGSSILLPTENENVKRYIHRLRLRRLRGLIENVEYLYKVKAAIETVLKKHTAWWRSGE